jgi:hypothetical protein
VEAYSEWQDGGIRRSIGMKNFAKLLVFTVLAATAWAQSPDATPAPQTARQALIEMFFSKTTGTFAKHLPAATLSTLDKSGALEKLQAYSLLARQYQTKEKTLETFETGSVLLAADNSQTGQKFEMLVESDSLQGDEDNIEVSFQTYKEKQVQRTGITPRMTFNMKIESGVWKLNALLVSLRVPLADPDFLKSITEGMKSQSAAVTPMQIQGRTSTTTPGMDTAVLTAMRSILTAEIAYAATYPSVGFTCTLSDLDGFGGGAPNEHQAMLIPSGLASGKKHGYVFALSGCTGVPANSFHLVATPAMATSGASFGRRAFCSDQSGAIRSSADGNGATCLSSGVPEK